MRFPKLFISALTSCVFAGASGSAMAEGCGDGVLQGERFDGTLRVSDETSCTIIGSTIGGDIRITNVANVLLINNRVDGEIQVNGNASTGTANVIENTVFGGELVVRDYETANVIGNETLNNKSGNIEVISNISAFVQQNISARNLICENTDTDASYNVAVKQEKCE
jgi:hypothetical protein